MKKVFKVKSLFGDSVSLFDNKTGEMLSKKQIVRLRARNDKKKQTKLKFE
jgi:hypothetical protein